LFVKKVKAVKLSDVEAVQPLQPGCYERWIFDKRTPTEGVAMVVATFAPQKCSGLHTHDVEELFFMLKGGGRAIVGDKEYRLEPNLAIYAPPETPHNFINTEDEPLVLLAVLGGREFKTTTLQGTTQP